jgi:hypothetical protein
MTTTAAQTGGEVVGTPFPSNFLNGPSVAGDGMPIVTGTDDPLLVWDFDPTDWPELACHAAGRNMTLHEREQHGSPAEPYRATCQLWESGS